MKLWPGNCPLRNLTQGNNPTERKRHTHTHTHTHTHSDKCSLCNYYLKRKQSKHHCAKFSHTATIFKIILLAVKYSTKNTTYDWPSPLNIKCSAQYSKENNKCYVSKYERSQLAEERTAASPLTLGLGGIVSSLFANSVAENILIHTSFWTYEYSVA